MEENRKNEEIQVNTELNQNIEQKAIQQPEQKKNKKKMLLLLLLLILTAIMLSASTYAWFTSNRTVTIEDINVNVAASGGIQISVDGSNWKSILTNTDLLNAHTTYSAATNQIPGTLKPVSTTAEEFVLDSNDASTGYLKMFLGTVSTSDTTTNRGEYILSAEDVSTVGDNSVSPAVENQGSAGNFVMFDVFLRLDSSASTAQPIYLTNGSNVVVQNNASDLGTQNSARIAFIKESQIATGSSIAQIQALKTSNINDIIIWEPNYDTHTSTGLANALSYYNDSNSGNQYTVANRTPKEQVPYFGVESTIAVSDDITLKKANATDNSSKFSAVSPSIATPANWSSGNTYEQLFSLTPNTITKVRIYFWIEGQDMDCENNASGGQLTLKLQFSLNDGPASTTTATTESTTTGG